MLKFFRKYNKRILAIVTAFLMIAFVGGQALTTFLAPKPGREVIATAFGEELIQADRTAMDRETADERPVTTVKNPVHIADLHSTIYRALGIAPDHHYLVEKRPFYTTPDGKGRPIEAIFA